MREINKFGIANFKPFGEKLQRFDLKPITLIYGPNSIGKSSIIHSISYFNNLYKTSTFSPSEIKLGDTINLGGFQNFVHKKDPEKEVSLEFTYAGTVDNSLDKLRTGKYQFEEREYLLNLIPLDMHNQIKDAFIKNNPWVHINSGDSRFFYWLEENFNDFDLEHFDMSRLETFIHETAEYETNLFGKRTIPPFRYTKKIYNKPLGTMEKFYIDASVSTKDLLNIKQLYCQTIKKEKFTDNEWVEEKNDETESNEYLRDDKFELTEDFFINALEKASDEQLKIFTEDLYEFIQKTYNLDDKITINTTIGKTKSGEVSDTQTIYSIGKEWLFKSILTEKIEGCKNTENQNYLILLNPEHWFIDQILHNIQNYGKWDSNKEIVSAIKKYLSEGDGIVSLNSYITEKKSILLELENIHPNDIGTFFEWNHDFETKYINYIKRSSEEITEDLKMLKNEDHSKEAFDAKFDISDDIYERISENQELCDLADEYGIHNIADIVSLILFSWIVDVNKAVKKSTGMKYIGPLRSFPERHEFAYADREIESDASTYAWELLKHDNKLQAMLNVWLSSDKLKTPYELGLQKHVKLNEQNIMKMQEVFKDKRKKHFSEDDFNMLDQIKEFSFYDKRYNTPVNIREMGLGVSQVLPILVTLFSEKGQVIAVEQPELHLHPAVQSDLADEFIKSFKDNSNTSIVETHSEHLLLRLMKRMRQTVEGTLPNENLSLTPNDVSILYVDADENKTYVLELQLDEDGSLLDPWPGGFFEEGFTERFF